MPFSYGGCLGNQNRFDSKMKCQQACFGSNIEQMDVCSQPYEPGPCLGEFVRYYYNQINGECRQFNYTGCKGNKNRFTSMEECENVCRHQARLVKAEKVCYLRLLKGSCNETIPVWHFDSTLNRCVPFFYSGCEGNENRFMNRIQCEKTCLHQLPPKLSIVTPILAAEEGQDIILKITLEANPLVKVTWYFKGEILDLDHSDRTSFSSTDHVSLSISQVLISDSGVYTVMADNGHGPPARKQIVLKVNPSRVPIKVTINKDVTTYAIGEDIRIACNVRGYPIPVIRWFKNNSPLRIVDRVSVEEPRNALVIKNVNHIDGGTYACRYIVHSF